MCQTELKRCTDVRGKAGPTARRPARRTDDTHNPEAGGLACLGSRIERGVRPRCGTSHLALQVGPGFAAGIVFS